jgi:hypothetical protein
LNSASVLYIAHWTSVTRFCRWTRTETKKIRNDTNVDRISYEVIYTQWMKIRWILNIWIANCHPIII